MNKKLLVMALLAGGSFTSMVHAADGTLAITGEIIDAGCDINSGNKNISVPMGKISKAAFTNAGGSRIQSGDHQINSPFLSKGF